MQKFFWLGVGVLVGLVVVLGLAFSRPYALRGSVLLPPAPAPALEISDMNGQDFNLASERERVVLIFFGYTTCPDVCPATLSELKELKQRLGDKAQQVRIVFVSVDPQRDTPQKLKSYLGQFDPDLIGITGSEEQLTPVWESFWVSRQIQPVQDNPDSYLVDHTARVYLIDKQGDLRLTFTFGTPVEDMEGDVRYLLRE